MSEQTNVASSNKRIAKNTLFLYVRLAVVMLVNLYATRVVLDVLGVEDYGIYNVVCGFVAMFGFLNTSMTNGIQRFYNYELGKGGDAAVAKVYNTGVIIQGLVAFIFLALLLTFGWWYLNAEIVIPESRAGAANWVYIFSVLSMVFVIMQAPFSAAVIAYERMDFYALVSVLNSFITLAVVFLIKYAGGDKLIIYGLALMLLQLFCLLLYYLYCKRHFVHLKIERSFNKTLFKEMFKFSGWNIFGSFAFMLRSQGVNVLLNQFFGPTINAANGIASQVASAVQAFSLNIMVAFQPQLVQSYASNDYKRTEQLMLNMTSLSYLLYCILAIPIVIEIRYILELWLGGNVPEYTEQFAILTVVIMGLGLFHTSITQVFMATGKLKTFQIVTSIIICAILPISWLCLQNGASPESVYVVTIAIFVVNFLICLLLLHREFKFDFKRYVIMIAKCTIVTILALCISRYVHSSMQSSFIRLLSVGCVAALVISCGYCATLSKSERSNIIATVKKKININKS